MQAGKKVLFVSVAGWRNAFRLALLGGLAVSLSGCLLANRRGGTVPYDVKSFGAPDPITAASTSPRYQIAPGDMLAISVYKVDELSRIVEVDADGTFDYPLIGKVQANGLSTADVKALMEKKLGASYLQEPKVDVSLKSTVANQITLDGSVTAPGYYPVSPGLTLLRAVAMAKGTTTDANPRRVVVFRQINGQRQAAAFDLTDIRRGAEPDPDIFARDIIVVDGNTARRNWTDALSTMPLLTFFRPF